MNELQILRDELDIDHAAGGIFQIPDIVLAFFLRDRAAHLGDVAGDDRGIAWPRQHLADDRLDLGRNSGDAEITRARVSAMCSQVQAS